MRTARELAQVRKRLLSLTLAILESSLHKAEKASVFFLLLPFWILPPHLDTTQT